MTFVLILCFRPLLSSQIADKRGMKLGDRLSVYRATNSVHKTSCVQAYYQAGVFSTRLNMLLELFSQIVEESCFDTLRTKEQLGYTERSGVWRSNGTQGFRVLVQGSKHPQFLNIRIEAFIKSMGETLDQMEASDFMTHVTALATKILEKPKQLCHKNDVFWHEITSQQYNFDRASVEVEMLRTLTKLDILQFYKSHVADSPSRRKLSCQVVSTCEGGAGHPDTAKEEVDAINDKNQGKPTEPRNVSNITAFKASLTTNKNIQ